MTNTREVLVERESIQDSTQVNGAFSTQEAVLKGPAILNPTSGDLNGSIKLSNTLYVPDISHNLISVKELCERGCEVIFKANSCEIVYKGKVILEGILQDDFYVAKTLINKAIPQEKDIEY